MAKPGFTMILMWLTSSMLHKAVVLEIQLGLGSAHVREFTYGSSPRCDDNATGNLSIEPDGTVCLSGHRPGRGNVILVSDADGNLFPNVIVEVAWHESEAHVRDKALTRLTLSNATYGVHCHQDQSHGSR
jgi:hypothetical protein